MSAAPRSSLFFWLACLAEGALVVLAALIAWPIGRPVLADLHWSVADLAAGVVASVPLCALFWYLMRSPLAPLARIRGFLARHLYAVAAPWSVAQIATVCVLAGLCEEILFRGVIQGALSDWLGRYTGLIVASVLFGCAHLVTLGYGVIAGMLGVYLGLLWMASGNLLVPVVTHAAYDFAALLYLLRLWGPRQEAAA